MSFFILEKNTKNAYDNDKNRKSCIYRGIFLYTITAQLSTPNLEFSTLHRYSEILINRDFYLQTFIISTNFLET